MSHAVISCLWECFSVHGILQSFALWLFPWVGRTKVQPRPLFSIGLPVVSSRKSAVLGNTSPKANMEEEMTLPVYDFELLYFCAK